jgi:glycosyltransferase involved in cell wall biosynthesis
MANAMASANFPEPLMSQTAAPLFTLVIETYNLLEGTDRDRFQRMLGFAQAAAQQHAAEVLLADVSGDGTVREMVARCCPEAVRLDVEGLGYDAAKMAAARHARGDWVMYLDADVEPSADALDQWLAAVERFPEAAALAGRTRYPGGLLATLMSIQDFGWLFETEAGPVPCYAFNNVMFKRSALLACPVPEGPARCECFAHAQKLLREGYRVELVANALAWHDLPPIVRERTRRGHDIISVCWSNAALPEARWLRWGKLSLPLFYGLHVALDYRRLLQGRRALGVHPSVVPLAFVLLPLLRLLDLGGMLHALRVGRGGPVWGGFAWPTR